MKNNNILSFGQLSFVMSGVKIAVRYRKGGTFGGEIFAGTIEDLHSPENRVLHNEIDQMQVVYIDAEESVLLIGVDKD